MGSRNGRRGNNTGGGSGPARTDRLDHGDPLLLHGSGLSLEALFLLRLLAKEVLFLKALLFRSLRLLNLPKISVHSLQFF